MIRFLMILLALWVCVAQAELSTRDTFLVNIVGDTSNDVYPIKDGNTIRFLYGHGRARLVCAPLRLCLIELEPGERITRGGLHLGDSHRWIVSGTTGAGITQLVFKPVVAGLETTATIVTDRRTYYLDLISHETEYMPIIGWIYPQKITLAKEAMVEERADAKNERTLPHTAEDIASLDFNYSISDCKKCAWRPLRVYNNGQQTIIQFSSEAMRNELPALLFIGIDDEESLVNYRRRGDRYVVDIVFNEAVLVTGVGRKQTRVIIRRMDT